MTWSQIFLQESIQLLKKDPRRIIFIIGAPIAYLFLFDIEPSNDSRLIRQ